MTFTFIAREQSKASRFIIVLPVVILVGFLVVALGDLRPKQSTVSAYDNAFNNVSLLMPGLRQQAFVIAQDFSGRKLRVSTVGINPRDGDIFAIWMLDDAGKPIAIGTFRKEGQFSIPEGVELSPESTFIVTSEPDGALSAIPSGTTLASGRATPVLSD